MIDVYIKELESDLKIDELNLKDYQLKLPGIKHKWAGRYIRHKYELLQLRSKRGEIKRSLVEQIQHTSPVKLAMPIIERTAEKHSEMKDIDAKINELSLVTELLEKAEKTLSSTSFDLKNLIDIIKLETT
jgi:hypothetical protein